MKQEYRARAICQVEDCGAYAVTRTGVYVVCDDHAESSPRALPDVTDVQFECEECGRHFGMCPTTRGYHANVSYPVECIECEVEIQIWIQPSMEVMNGDVDKAEFELFGVRFSRGSLLDEYAR